MIEPYEANAWSVFQAFVEIQELSKNILGFTKQSGYSIYVDAGASDYNKNTGVIRLYDDDFFDWDVIAHEYSHAIAYETSSTTSDVGGCHDGSNQYQYNCNGNDNTYFNKERSLSLAFNEGYATWLGVALLESSEYKGKMPNVGDGIYQDRLFGSNDIVHILEANTKKNNAFGEDTEEAIMGLLWDITDTPNEANSRALCKNSCKDSLSIPLLNVFNGALKSKNIKNISEFYSYLYSSYVSKQSLICF
jgi:hypothetical protein